MPFQDLSIARRFRRPATWGAILMFGFVWGLVRWLAGRPFGRMGWGELLIPVLVAAGHLALGPLPWQWARSRRGRARLWQGGLTALFWNTAWLGLLLLGLQGFFPKEPPPRGPRPGEPPPVAAPAPVGSGSLGGLLPLPTLEVMFLLLNLPFALLLGWFLAEKEQAEDAQEDLRALARAAQIRALQAQLHPHALYNVLGGLTELVHEDADAAEQALVGLVELLRMLTRQGDAEALPLAQERLLLKLYLRIEEIRLGPRLRVQWDWPAWADALVLPPLLLQPLVENAVKHGIAPRSEGGTLRIAVSRLGGDLVLGVANTAPGLGPGNPEGTGLRNLRERLALMPRLGASLDLRWEGGWVLAEVRLRAPLPCAEGRDRSGAP